ncbi:LacI family DNA-binding transcriptional regulator [Flexivirga sp. ID2601S]|uniref:LacI family DNA-binding transcriptional regulator n=2 Tax=Flexivirga aerilata TaxID=1656889 RepID=A0A849AHL9_9MICO|nr:LacI family DNA-binding transcriptional regulator [Flexivirga aerilata]
MHEVAARAGVSTSTVSHVINGTRHVAPDTRDAVLQAVAALDYAITPHPQTAAGRRTIGLVITGASNPYNGELIQGVEGEATRAGFGLFLCDSHDDPRREAEAVRGLITHNAEAVVIAPTPEWEAQALPMLRKSERPFVLVDRLSSARCDQVSAESESVSATLVEHLIDLGHRRIGMLSGLPGLSTSIERVRGYQRALSDAGIPIDPALIACGESRATSARAATLQLMRGNAAPTALFSANNAMTIGALQALGELGLRIPDDLAVVAFDDFEWAAAMTPALTAVAQPFHAMGAQAVQLLLRRLQDPLAPRRVVRLPTEIAHRHSCGCVAPRPRTAGVP